MTVSKREFDAAVADLTNKLNSLETTISLTGTLNTLDLSDLTTKVSYLTTKVSNFKGGGHEDPEVSRCR